MSISAGWYNTDYVFWYAREPTDGEAAMADLGAQPRNKLLHSLSPEILRQLLPHLEPAVLKPRRVLQHARLPIEQVYFIETGLVSVVAATDEENHSAEGWITGCEGLAGTPVVLGVMVSPHRRIVQMEGRAWMMRSADLAQAMEAIPELRRVLLRYVHSVLIQTAQIGACNARHSLAQRLARWLLMADDRVGAPGLVLTHEAIARMLGVRRASITTALDQLEHSGAISMQRRKIAICDRTRLVGLSCHCYSVLRGEFARDFPSEIMPPDPVSRPRTCS